MTVTHPPALPDALRTPDPVTDTPADQSTETLSAEALIEEVSIDGMCGVY